MPLATNRSRRPSSSRSASSAPPTPVGRLHADLPRDVAEATVPVEEEGVAAELAVVALSLCEATLLDRLELRLGTVAPLVRGEHLRHEDFRIAVAVEIGHVGAHRPHAGLGHEFGEPFGKTAVAAVDVQVVPLEEVVGDVEVGPAVAVDVADGHAEPEADVGAVDAGLLADVGEAQFALLGEEVAVELVAAQGIARFALSGADVVASDGADAVVEEVQV